MTAGCAQGAATARKVMFQKCGITAGRGAGTNAQWYQVPVRGSLPEMRVRRTGVVVCE
jgi:hypothetical protein